MVDQEEKLPVCQQKTILSFSQTNNWFTVGNSNNSRFGGEGHSKCYVAKNVYYITSIQGSSFKQRLRDVLQG